MTEGPRKVLLGGAAWAMWRIVDCDNKWSAALVLWLAVLQARLAASSHRPSRGESDRAADPGRPPLPQRVWPRVNQSLNIFVSNYQIVSKVSCHPGRRNRERTASSYTHTRPPWSSERSNDLTTASPRASPDPAARRHLAAAALRRDRGCARRRRRRRARGRALRGLLGPARGACAPSGALTTHVCSTAAVRYTAVTPSSTFAMPSMPSEISVAAGRRQLSEPAHLQVGAAAGAAAPVQRHPPRAGLASRGAAPCTGTAACQRACIVPH